MDYGQFVEINRVHGRWDVRLRIESQSFTVAKTADGSVAEWYADKLTRALEVLHQKFMEAE